MKYFFSIVVIAISFFIGCQKSATGEYASKINVSEVREVSVQDTNEALLKDDVQFIDVRTNGEYRSGHAKKAVNIPLDALENEFNKLDQKKPVYVICQTGNRSAKGARILSNAGFSQVFNVKGGTSAWIAADLPTEMVSSK